MVSMAGTSDAQPTPPPKADDKEAKQPEQDKPDAAAAAPTAEPEKMETEQAAKPE